MTHPEINPADIKPGMVVRAEWGDKPKHMTEGTVTSADERYIQLDGVSVGVAPGTRRWFLVADVPKPEPKPGEIWMVRTLSKEQPLLCDGDQWVEPANLSLYYRLGVTPLYRMELHREGEARPTKDEVLAAIDRLAFPTGFAPSKGYFEGMKRGLTAAVAALFDRAEAGR